MERPDWDEYFVDIAKLTSKRSNCIKRKVGCIIVKDTRIISLGYNGTPKGFKNCFEGGCDRCNSNAKSGENLDLCMCLHAEENALLFVKQRDLDGSTMYITLIPCISCVKKIIQCGVKRIVYNEDYNICIQEKSIKMMKEHGLTVEKK